MKEEKTRHRHKWKIGAGIGGLVKLKNGQARIRKVGHYIYCEKCRKRLKAYY